MKKELDAKLINMWFFDMPRAEIIRLNKWSTHVVTETSVSFILLNFVFSRQRFTLAEEQRQTL